MELGSVIYGVTGLSAPSLASVTKNAVRVKVPIRDLMATLVQSKAFMYRPPSPGETL